MSNQHNAASMPYISETQARHAPMTTGPAGHTHDHASFGASDHDDGVHMHRHVHANDADHDHDHSDLSGAYYNPPGPATGISTDRARDRGPYAGIPLPLGRAFKNQVIQTRNEQTAR